MLELLKVRNVALIEEAQVAFGAGLNILSGETGAGKSILIDSINFVLGQRASSEIIRGGAERAEVEIFFTISDSDIISQIREMGMDIDDDGGLLLARVYTINGKNTCRCNGKTVTITMIREISALLIDIHGQHEHQSLLDSGRHLHLLDRFCQDELAAKKARVGDLIRQYRAVLRNSRALLGDEGQRDAQMEIYRYQLAEFEDAALNEGEEEALIQRRKILQNAERIGHLAAGLAGAINGEGGANALDLLSRAAGLAAEIAQLDEEQKDLAFDIEGIYSQLQEAAREAAKYWENLESNPEELADIETRLDAIYRIKRKYGGTVAAALEHYNEVKSKLDFLINSEAELDKLKQAQKLLQTEINRICGEISLIRQIAAQALQNQIESVLGDLGMPQANFAINISRADNFTADGYDLVDFMFSANPGEALAPLSKIASGGEMSRVMLALKTVLSKYDNIATFIFDEIDAGVSGRTAQQVAEKLSIIGRNHQILCITHLPQIAAMGDVNFLIEKTSTSERTITNIHNLDEKEIINELARLIGGAEITEHTRKAAKDMRRQAAKIKG